MTKGFTLIELLVVIGIMGLMGTAAVGGYRQLQEGMETRGVMENADQFMSVAYRRAQIDRQSVAVFFWNELVRQADSAGYESEIVVGRAVAVRIQGRTTKGDSSKIIDEFGDFARTYAESEESGASSGKAVTSAIRVYNLKDLSSDSGPKFSDCRPVYDTGDEQGFFLGGTPTDADGGKIEYEYLSVIPGSGGKADWSKPGTPYGFEFATVTLPHGYIFESAKPSSAQPVRDVKTIVFSPGKSGSSTVSVSRYALNASGTLEPETIGSTKTLTLERY